MPHEKFTHLQTKGLPRVTALEMMHIFPPKPSKVENRETLFVKQPEEKLVASVILVKKICLRKLLTFCNATSGLSPCKMTFMEQVQKFHTDDMSLPRSESCF